MGGDRLTSHAMRFVLESTIFRGELLVSERVPSGELTWQLKSPPFSRGMLDTSNFHFLLVYVSIDLLRNTDFQCSFLSQTKAVSAFKNLWLRWVSCYDILTPACHGKSGGVLKNNWATLTQQNTKCSNKHQARPTKNTTTTP